MNLSNDFRKPLYELEQQFACIASLYMMPGECFVEVSCRYAQWSSRIGSEQPWMKNKFCLDPHVSLMNFLLSVSRCNKVLARFSGGSPEVLRGFSGGSPEVLRRFSGGSPGVLRRFSEGSSNNLGRTSGEPPENLRRFYYFYQF